MPIVSTCIVTYNNADNIERTLDSYYKNVLPGISQLYISDNNSTDATLKIVREKFPQAIVLENKENGGFAKGNNKVLPLLESQYHFIINPDIIFRYDVISAFVDFFDKNKNVIMAVPKLLYENGEEQFTPKLTPTIRYMLGGRLEKFGNPFRKWRTEYTMRDREINEVIDVGFCSGCFIAIRTDVFIKLGGFDERYFLYSEDADLTRMAKAYGRTVYNPFISAVHLWERGYTKSNKLFFIQICSMFKYFIKWKGKK